MSIQRTLATLRRPAIVKRGLFYAVTVGTLLVLINQSDVLMTGKLNSTQIWQILLTYTVPYMVSSLSSAQAVMAQEDATATDENRPSP